VNVNADYSDKINGMLYNGGAFMGNKVLERTETEIVNNKPFETEEVPLENYVIANQQVNPDVLEGLDYFCGKPGVFIKHEVTESYVGAKISQETGISALPAIKGNSTYSTIYEPAHGSRDTRKQPLVTFDNLQKASQYAKTKPFIIQAIKSFNHF